MSGQPEQRVLLTARFIAVALLFNIAILTVLAFLIASGKIAAANAESPIDPATAKSMRAVFLALGAGFPFLSLVVRRTLDARVIATGGSPQRHFSNLLVAFALCEVPAMLGLVAAILLHDVRAVVLLGLFSFVAGLIHFPRQGMFRQ